MALKPLCVLVRHRMILFHEFGSTYRFYAPPGRRASELVEQAAAGVQALNAQAVELEDSVSVFNVSAGVGVSNP
ncbi:hypothetical protein [Paraburkholderia ferrariae]|uniref:Uncharacterized protein n=1 Tax=Paraburkholderia ferrariae TaxID=386056 RepID=A0ABU9S1Q0_9BURK